MIFKCKMCGGELEVTEGASVAECPYCGAKQTLPKLDNERRANLYDRAGHFRRMSDFDKAMALYEQILNEDTTDAEAYWSIVLCRYGIEYVEDPMTHKRIPTVNRVQRTSVFADEDYKSALAYADGYQRELYEAEAKEIEEIQKGILAISEKEEPFDVFICYKETDANGERTRDSVLANDLYYELTKEGYKVFFSRITLEDKLGTAYEPYIFAALQSARVMVVVGTKAENFNAPWVKNEWSRYLALIRSGAKKTLIPAYRDMDPYDLPDAFSHLQAQDMSKLGFMQDLTRGIKKLLTDEEKKTIVVEAPTATGSLPNTGTVQFLKRARIFIEDGDWQSGDEYVEHALDIDPEDADAYLLKMLITLQLHSESALNAYDVSIAANPNYIKALRYSKGKRHEEIASYETQIQENIRSRTYQKARELYQSRAYSEARRLFLGLGDYRDAKQQADTCVEAEKRAQHENTVNTIRNDYAQHQNDESWLASAIKTLGTLNDYAPALELRGQLQARLDDVQAEERAWKEEERRRREEAALQAKREAELQRIRCEKRRQRVKHFLKWAIPTVSVICALLLLTFNWWIPAGQYHKAEKLIGENDYVAATKVLRNIKPGFRNCDTRLYAMETVRAIDRQSGQNLADDISHLLSAGIPVKVTYETVGGTLQSGESVRLTALSDEKDTFGTVVAGENAVCFYQKSADFTDLETVAKDGYQFLEWKYVTSSFDISGKDDVVAVTLRAVWTTKAYTLTFDLGGGTIKQELPARYGLESENITIGQPTRRGYTFVGWTGTGLTEPAKKIRIPAGSWGDRSYTALWQANTYTLTLDANGGTTCDAETVTVTYDSVPVLPTPVWAGHTFSGWYCGTKAYGSTAYVEDSDLTLTAAWDLIWYPVTYHLNGGKNAANNVSTYNVRTGLFLSAPTRKGYTFVGWTYTGHDSPEKDVSLPAGTIGAQEFTATWQANTYTLTLNVNGGTCEVNSIEATFDSPVALPTPSRVGYDFIGWYLGDTVYRGDNWALDTAATLVARWQAKTDITYRVEHYQQDAIGDGYTRTEEQSYTGTADSKVTPATKIYTGFVAPAKQTVTVAPDGSLVVKYYYTRKVYTATTVTNGGSAVPTQSGRYMAPLTMETPVRDGFTFGGWYTDADLTNEWNGTLSDNTTLYAHWAEETKPCDLGYVDQTDVSGYQIAKYTGSSTTLWLPAYIGGKPVTAIADNAFADSMRLTVVVLPEDLVYIGHSSFKNCTSLLALEIPSSVTKIGGDAFVNCSALETLSIGDGVSRLPKGLLSGCSSLQNLAIPFVGEGDSSPDAWSGSLFGFIFGTSEYSHSIQTKQYYGNIQSAVYYVPATLSNLTVARGDLLYGAFWGCSQLKSVTLKEGVATIGERAFNGCDQISSITIGSGVKDIGEYAFADCKGIETLSIPSSVVSIRPSALWGCSNIETLILPYIGYEKTVESPGPLTVLGFLFGNGTTNSTTIKQMYGSGRLECVSYDIPDSLKHVVVNGGNLLYGALSNCAGLLSLTLGDGVSIISKTALMGCTSLAELTISPSVVELHCGADPKRINISDLSAWCKMKCSGFRSMFDLYCDGKMVDDLVIPIGITSIPDNAFDHCSSLISVTIPDSVTNIGKNAFYECSNIKTVTVGSGVVSIGGAAFHGCSRLTEFIVPMGVTIIEASTFSDCFSLRSVMLPNSIVAIGNYAFRECRSLSTITFPQKIMSIGREAFRGCAEIAVINLPDTTEKIEDYAFAECIGLTTIMLPNGLTTIGEAAFSGCTKLKDVVVPESVTNIGNAAFSKCAALESLTVPIVGNETNTWLGQLFGVTSFEGGVVSKKYNSSDMAYVPATLTKLTVTGGTIGWGAISGFANLNDVVIGNNVHSIGDSAFYGCSSLQSITCPYIWGDIGNSSTFTKTFGYIFGTKEYNASTKIMQYSQSGSSNIYYVPSSLIRVTITDGILPYGAFQNCSMLSSVVLGEQVSLHGERQFENCTGLTQVTLMSNITEITNGMFYNCGLTSINIPESVTKIDFAAFAQCVSLEMVLIPSNVCYIGQQAFGGCSSLTSVAFANAEGWYCTDDVNAASGNTMLVDDLAKNAENLVTNYYNYYWKKS